MCQAMQPYDSPCGLFAAWNPPQLPRSARQTRRLPGFPTGLGPRSLTSHSYSRSSSSIRRLPASCRPSRHLAYRPSSTSTLLPARAATSVGSTPALSQVESAECRRSYGRRARAGRRRRLYPNRLCRVPTLPPGPTGRVPRVPEREGPCGEPRSIVEAGGGVQVRGLAGHGVGGYAIFLASVRTVAAGSRPTCMRSSTPL